jgi:serine phosphatase RsbU (regulator of sigma subunit)
VITDRTGYVPREGTIYMAGSAPAGPANLQSRWVDVPVEPQVAGDGSRVPARPGAADLGGLATFTLDAEGQVASWSGTAARMFGITPTDAAGQHVCDVLLTGPGQRQLIDEALDEVTAGRVWMATVAVAQAGGGPVALRCEQLAGPGTGTLVIAEHASPQPGQGLLVDAVTRIGTTLDLLLTAREAVEVAVPGFADVAAIFVTERLMAADETGGHRQDRETVVRRLAARLADRSAAETDELLRPGEVVIFGPKSPASLAMAAGSPVTYNGLDPETAARISRRPGGPDFVAGHASFIAAPLVARGSVIGCVLFGRASCSPPFGRTDIALADELAARAAVCIDNALLFRRQRRTAEALQRGLLPGQPDIPAGLEVARRYLPAGENVVGGDWHDIVALPGGRAALIVGDAMGHGPEAAAVMVQLRTAAHALAEVELPPEEVLRRLDRIAAGMAGAPFATCLCAVLDPADRSCVIAQAGHLPPMLALADGGTATFELPPGLPLGLGAETFLPTQISVPAGATLALYTDGLVESRVRPLDAGMVALGEVLSAALAEPGCELDTVCRKVTRALHQQGEDDVTLVLARVR